VHFLLFLHSLNKNKLKTLIVLDAPNLYRIGLKTYLQKLLVKVKIIETETWQQLEQKLKTTSIDYLFVAPENLNYQELEKVIAVKKLQQTVKIIIMSQCVESTEITHNTMFSYLDVDAVISKNVSENVIFEMMKTISNNKKYYCIDFLQKNIIKHKTKNLSARELEILKQIAYGHDANEIAAKLFISIHTFRTHRKNIMKKIGIHSTSELILYAIKEKIV
jgi:DNA-binding NarL/FixJ family response regulator